MHLPPWEELSKEQRKVQGYPLDKSLFVVGPPGSGKTTLAIQRAEMLLENQPTTVIVTFYRMLRRLMTLLSEDRVQVKTMHSFVSSDYMTRTNESPPSKPDNSYEYVWKSMLLRMQREKILPNTNHLVVDEGQDLPPGFFQYASRYIARNLTIFSDEDQALNDPGTTLEQIREAAGLGNPILLSQNHRNTPQISRLAECFHSGRLPAAAVRRSASGDLPRLIPEKDFARLTRMISIWFKNRHGSIGVIVAKNATGEKVRSSLSERLPETRIDIYTNQRANENEINILKDGITILNSESAKGLEFDTVFILELHKFIPCINDLRRRTMYMLCTRARDDLLLIYDPDVLSQSALAKLPGPDILERQ